MQALNQGFLKCSLMQPIPYVVRHFSENVKKRFHIKDVASLMDKAARAYTEFKYNRYMGELRNLHKNAFDYVESAGPHKWSRVHCPQRRFRVMTTNVAECINSCLKFARQLPMLTLAEYIRNMLQRWFHDPTSSCTVHASSVDRRITSCDATTGSRSAVI
ncbi:hypothetical protein Dsin_032304 [Dipteronia sinensis]|uniref:Transposase n=1 Tax=Dipteronia sinensis TaxID=43782 RepID=A0AAD9ZMU1_9ROSI|nr:hypothetical protein Dsin_032304 [Dipteronia sinensis]